jgi:ABC-type Fe3+-hydroxamate transport system substrate-binding protein
MQVTDQMGRQLRIPEHGPKRIISLVPSQTELLYELGLADRVVGITKFCVHPEGWFEKKTKVGGTKMVYRKEIEALQPDLIIGNKEENTARDIKRLEKKYPVWMSDIVKMKDAIDMIKKVGHITRKSEQALEIAEQIEKELNQVALKNENNPRIAYFIWKDPWMVVGNDTFIHHFCKKTGFTNVFSDMDRYPEINLDAIKERNPDFVFLSSEPFPFKEEHKKEFEKVINPERIRIVDGQMFSWYGSRLIKGVQYASNLRNKLVKA